MLKKSETVKVTAKKVIDSGRTAIPVRNGAPLSTFKDGEYYPLNDPIWNQADAVSIRLDGEILIDWDAHKTEGAATLEEIADCIGLTVPQLKDAEVQSNLSGDSLHLLFNREGFSYTEGMHHSQDGYLTGVDIKTGNQLMHIKPHKTLRLPNLGDTIKAPAALCEALAKNSYKPKDNRPDKDVLKRIREIQQGLNLHDNSMRLAARYAQKGLDEREILALIEPLFNHLPNDDRTQTRIDDLPRLIRSGIEKFGKPDEDFIGPHPLSMYRAPIPEIPQADDMLIKGILCAKLSFMGAYAGAGKTTTMVALVAIVSGLITVEGMDIDGWRNVVYISEHPEQFELSLKAMAKDLNLDETLISERIKVVLAQRMTAESIGKVVPDYQKLVVEHSANNVSVPFMPWVIIDTQASTLELESENDTAQASAAMATLKTRFNDVPLTIVAHTAKAHKHGDADSMSIRGAGSFEADSNQVMLLSYDKNTRQRFIEIAIPKHRFNALYDSLEVRYSTTELTLLDKFGRKVIENVGYCTVRPVSADQRSEIVKTRKQQADAYKSNKVLELSYSILESAETDKEVITKSKLRDKIKAAKVTGLQGNSSITPLIEELILDGALVIEKVDYKQMSDEGWEVNKQQTERIVRPFSFQVVQNDLDNLSTFDPFS